MQVYMMKVNLSNKEEEVDNMKANVITLTDELGNNIDYELLDIVDIDKDVYCVFYPTVENDTEVVILKVLESNDSDKTEYIVEQDEKKVMEVFEKFKEKYSDTIEFREN